MDCGRSDEWWEWSSQMWSHWMRRTWRLAAVDLNGQSVLLRHHLWSTTNRLDMSALTTQDCTLQQIGQGGMWQAGSPHISIADKCLTLDWIPHFHQDCGLPAVQSSVGTTLQKKRQPCLATVKIIKKIYSIYIHLCRVSLNISVRMCTAHCIII